MTINPTEQERYKRHLLLPEIGLVGQNKLKSASVLIVGLGGLGCPVSLYLSAAGVGCLGLIDFDVVDESNLQRQILYGTAQVGLSKVACAKERLSELNPHIAIEAYLERITVANARRLIS